MDKDPLSIHRSCAELLAISVQEVVPSLVPIAANISEYDFSYDFSAKQPCSESLLPHILAHMRKLIAKDLAFEVMTMVPKNAQEFLKQKQPIQTKLLGELSSNVVQLCKTGSFYDICPEEPLSSSGQIQECTIYEMSHPELFYPGLGTVSVVRIRGAAFEEKKSLKRFLKQVELAKKNDPLRLIEELDLASVDKKHFGERLFWHPRGESICQALEDLWKKACSERGVQLISTPRFRNGIKQRDERESSDTKFSHLKLFERYQQLGKPLPYRVAEQVHIEEPILSKDCDGLFMTKSMRGDRIHILCTPEQLAQEMISSLQFMKQIARMVSLECSFVLLYRKIKECEVITEAFSKLGISFETRKSPFMDYGWKVELRAMDLRGRKWPISEIGFEKIETNVNAGNCLLLSQAGFLSLERILAILLERDGGVMPLWLAPEQVRIFPVEASCTAWAHIVQQELCLAGIRASTDSKDGRLATKIYEASKQKVPVSIVIGEREVEKKVLNVRLAYKQFADISLNACIEAIAECCRTFRSIKFKNLKQLLSHQRETGSAETDKNGRYE